MKTQYNVEVIEGRTETIDLSVVSYVTDIITTTEVITQDHFFFNIIMHGGVSLSVIDRDKDMLVKKRKTIIKARAKFMNRFYKHMAKLNAKVTGGDKQLKRYKKNVKRELKLLREIRDGLHIPIRICK